MKSAESIDQENELKNIKRNVSVIQDADGNNIVMINDITFKGNVLQSGVMLKNILGSMWETFIEIAETEDIIYIGTRSSWMDILAQITQSMYKRTIAKSESQSCAGYPRDDRNRNIKDF
ncbi:MAG: hypothetical protein ACLU90_10935 [Lachnospira sp.]